MYVDLVSWFFSSANLPEFSKDARLLAALHEDEADGNKLLDAARRLAGAFSDLLNAAQPGSTEVGTHCSGSSIFLILCSSSCGPSMLPIICAFSSH